MPFDDVDPKTRKVKGGLQNIGKSMFDDQPKKPTPQQHTQNVQNIQNKFSGQMAKANELALQFNKVMADKTLPENKNRLVADMETELLRNMINLGNEINNDPDQENESYGSLSWIVVILKTCFAQRDRINQLEYNLLQLDKRTNSQVLAEFIKKEIDKNENKSNK